MAKARNKAEEQKETVVAELVEKKIEFGIIGITPLMFNALHSCIPELINPKPKGKKKEGLKHNPWLEYRQSVYAWNEATSLLCAPAVWFKHALCSICIDQEGWQRAPTARAVWACGERIPVWGIPKLDMRWVRPGGSGKAPDVRTRAYVEHWASKVTIRYDAGYVNADQVAALLSTSGLRGGVGDGRPQKGTLEFGRFELAEANDKRILALQREGGRAAQVAAMNDPDFSNVETEGWIDGLIMELSDPTMAGKGKEDVTTIVNKGRFNEGRKATSNRKAA